MCRLSTMTKVRRRHPPLFKLFLQQCAALALATTSAPASTFPRRKRREHKYAEAEEELISFYDYYQEYATSSLFSRFTLADIQLICSCVPRRERDRTHGITIRHMEQPLLKVIEKRRRPTDGVQVEEIIYLVPELCVLAGMTEEIRTNGQLRLALFAQIM